MSKTNKKQALPRVLEELQICSNNTHARATRSKEKKAKSMNLKRTNPKPNVEIVPELTVVTGERAKRVNLEQTNPKPKVEIAPENISMPIEIAPELTVVTGGIAKRTTLKRKNPESMVEIVPELTVVTGGRAKRMRSGGTQLVKLTQFRPKEGELCYAKLKVYCPWPSVVKEVTHNGVWVDFFNSNQEGYFSYDKIFNLKDGMQFLDKFKTVAFIKAAKEMAIVLDQTGKSKGSSKKLDPVYERYMALIKN